MAAGHQIFVIVYYLLAEGSFDDDERDDHLQPRQLGKSCLTLEKDLLERFATRCRGAVPIFPGGQPLSVYMCLTSE
jgi:hypothetical protein